LAWSKSDSSAKKNYGVKEEGRKKTSEEQRKEKGCWAMA